MCLWVGLACALASQRPSAAQDINVRDFVRQTFIHGVPYEDASRYGPAAVPILLGMLADAAEQEHWTNIVGVLGIIGDERAVDPLIAFAAARLEEPLGRPIRREVQCPLALGYLVNKNRNERALSYLVESLDPNVWLPVVSPGRVPIIGPISSATSSSQPRRSWGLP
jgi:hypothetical protein